MIETLNVSVSLLPVLLFLFALLFLDSYKLVKLRSLLGAIVVGGLLAILCLVINSYIMGLLSLSLAHYSRYLAPVVEELFKASYLAYLFWARRVGFIVDAAILGFAIGAGFAVVENIYFLHTLESPHLIVWVVRGLGTAAMHGGTTATLAILSKGWLDQKVKWGPEIFLPGLALAVVVHSLYNHFLLSPLLLSAAVVAVLTLILLLAFEASERNTRAWLNLGLDTEVELLEVINTGKLSRTKIGRYLSLLRSSLPGETVGDILCYLRVYLELTIRAKGVLLMREAGVVALHEAEIKEKLAELRYLEKSIGKAGKLAIQPLLRMSSRDLWQLYMLDR